MVKEQKRIDFKYGVSKTLFDRAGGRCSFPRCKNPTSGPSRSKNTSINMGVACHIYSAAKNGPRGQGGKDATFISSVENGIWCCKYHGDLIDKESGKDFPADNLFAWKALAEARTRKQMDDIPSALGWVESIEHIAFPTLSKLPKINLSRYTILYGRNCTGKTSLLEAAASINQSRYAERFQGTYTTDTEGNRVPCRFISKVIYSTVDTISKEIFIEVCGEYLIRGDGNISFLFPPGDIEVIYCSDKDCRRKETEDDMDFFMRVLGVDKCTLLSLAKIGARTIIGGEIKFSPAEEWNEEDGENQKIYRPDGEEYIEMQFRFFKRDNCIPFGCLSSSEKGKLILDLLITKAKEICKQKLTIFIVEDLAIRFDKGNFEALLNVLLECDFQSIVSMPPWLEDDILEENGGEKILKKDDFLKKWRLQLLQI
ncbi:hypothetical protein LV564_12005 [Komagataeibacter nataicola]|uniref:hypothetical protein n=1 Tax=Komagataeibacter nataicola TaxID=265960 RepID=UPI0011B4C774|nr:hypothetical protein [Komagataeibacter nataicola]WEQ54869.1 hypothetical protein LV564_12005 [Komagataeibacter nataicola]WNM09215.1 hypothetical protein RI056_04195 [Komagataeibacter nataicola]